MPSGGLTKAQTQERYQRIAELTRQGQSAAQIADELKITQRTVVRARVAMGVAQPPPRYFTDEERAQIEAMLEDGCSVLEIARTLGRHPANLWRQYPGRGWTREEGARFGSLVWQTRLRRGIEI